ncbi:MAG: HTH domain-containing protein [Sedimentisphaeraceae bacterium JB056]
METTKLTLNQKCFCKIGQNQVEATIIETTPQGPWLLKITKSGKTISVSNRSRITPVADEQIAVQASKNKYSLLDTAEIILKTSPHKPLNAKAIIKLAIEDELWKPGKGKTPANTLHASINKEIKTKGEASRFKRSPEVRGAFLLTAYYCSPGED